MRARGKGLFTAAQGKAVFDAPIVGWGIELLNVLQPPPVFGSLRNFERVYHSELINSTSYIDVETYEHCACVTRGYQGVQG